MKKVIALIFVAVLFSSLRVPPTQEQLIGTWSLIAYRYTYPDGTVLAKRDFKIPSIKIFTKNYFSWGKSANAYEEVSGAGGGQYVLNKDGFLIEKYEYSFNKELIGKDIEFWTNLRNDTLAIFGTLPNGTSVLEVYKQIEKP